MAVEIILHLFRSKYSKYDCRMRADYRNYYYQQDKLGIFGITYSSETIPYVYMNTYQKSANCLEYHIL